MPWWWNGRHEGLFAIKQWVAHRETYDVESS